MKLDFNRRQFFNALAATLAWLSLPAFAQDNAPVQRKKNGKGGGHGHRGAEDFVLPPELSAFSRLSLVLGRVSDQSATVSALAKETIEGFYEYGTAPGNYPNNTGVLSFAANNPVETVFSRLQPNTPYFYRLNFRKPGETNFVILDNYWHSPAQVDSGFHEEDLGGGKSGKGHAGGKQRDWWGLTLGDAQYHWFKRTLESSQAKYKFVFAHHVMGSGRGGVEACDGYEWGGRNRRGDWEFTEKRPGWEMPVHQLMVKHGVTIFFQGHDHLYAQQQRDGVVYQEVPMPADPGYVAYNADRYQSGVKLPNSGHLRVTVSPETVKVEYVRCYLPQDESAGQKTGDIAHSYTIPAKPGHV